MAIKVGRGSYTGNGSDNRSITGLGFQPKWVLIKQDTSSGGASGRATWINADSSWWFGDNTTPAANFIQALESDGFQIGTAAQVNTSGQTYFYIALGGDDSDIIAGSYAGNATDDRDITGIGFQPEAVFIHGSGNSNPPFRYASHTGDSSFITGGFGTTAADAIQGFGSDGFQVGTSVQVNASATTYYYLAIRNVSGAFVTGTYTGNSTDDRNITGLGFTPEAVLLTKSVAAYNSVFRGSHSGDSSSIVENNQANAADLIQSFGSGQFQIGANTRVNLSSSTYYWMAAATSSSTNVKTWDGVTRANVKTLDGVASASIKSINGVT